MRRQTVISWSSSSVVTGLKKMRLCLSSGIKSDIKESFLEGKFAGSQEERIQGTIGAAGVQVSFIQALQNPEGQNDSPLFSCKCAVPGDFCSMLQKPDKIITGSWLKVPEDFGSVQCSLLELVRQPRCWFFVFFFAEVGGPSPSFSPVLPKPL